MDLGFGEAFDDRWQGFVGEASQRDGERDVAQQGQGAGDVGVAAARGVLPQDVVFTPVVPDFDAAPVAADGGDASRRRKTCGVARADELAVFPAEGADAFMRAAGADADAGAHAGKTGLVALERQVASGVLGYESAGVFRWQGKRGARPSKAACRRLCRVGWLSLTCTR